MDDSVKTPAISYAALFKGLGLVVIVYAALAGYVASNKDETLRKLEDNLAADYYAIRPNLPPPPPQETDITQDITDDVEAAGIKTNSEASAKEEDEKPLEILPELKKTALLAAPIQGLYRKIPEGLYPAIRDDGITSFEIYKRPFVLTGKPLIALVAYDYGLSSSLSNDLVKTLPSEVSVILSPYVQEIDVWREKARSNGHEVWLNIPFETANFPHNDPGPLGILSTYSLKRARDLLKIILTRTTGYAGITAYYDEGFSSNARSSYKSIVNEALNDTGLGYLDMNINAAPEGKEAAANHNAPYLQVNIKTEGGILNSKLLNIAAVQARKTGYAIVPVALTPVNIKLLREWTDGLVLSGLSLAPLSAIYNVK